MTAHHPIFNMTLAELRQYHEDSDAIKAIRLAHRARGIVSPNDALMVEQLALLDIIIRHGNCFYSQQQQEILYHCTMLYHSLRQLHIIINAE